jgi:Mrp family chromosome partitioning ATPase
MLRRIDQPQTEFAPLFSSHLATKNYDALKVNLLTRYPDRSIKSVLFTGCNPGDGVSTTAINFAASLARGSRVDVLLIEANHKFFSFYDLCKPKYVYDPIGPPWNLHLLRCNEGGDEFGAQFQYASFEQLLKLTREKFGYIILDAPPVHICADSLLLSSLVDGVILVINSGRTRRPVALRAKQQLEEAGARLLGIVLNRRRFYIPGFIYRWL